MWCKNLTGLLCVTALASCGAVFIPNEVKRTAYGYHNTNYGNVEVLPLTFASAQDANEDGYKPRPLPDVFADEAYAPGRQLSVRERLRREGLDVIEPPLVVEPDQARLDPEQEVLPPFLRNDNQSAAPTIYVPGGGVDTASRPEILPELEALPDAPSYGNITPKQVALDPLPDIRPGPYRIGAGDSIGLISTLESIGYGGGAASEDYSATTKRLLVEGNGRIFVPQAGSIAVGGKTLAEARQAIFDRLVGNDLDFEFGVEILEFGSQKVAISGPDGASLLPITVRPLMLGEAIVSAGGLGSDPDNVVVRVLRDGKIYEIPGSNLIRDDGLSERLLVDGDSVFISPIYDLDRALGFFNQQLQIRSLREADLNRQRSELERAQARVQYDMMIENYRRNAELLRQEAALAQFAAQREAEQANEAARIANLAARQNYIDQLRSIAEANRAVETRRIEILQANASERARNREERRELLELELAEEQNRLDRLVADRERARAAFAGRAQFDAIERDYVFITGETTSTQEVEMPLGRSYTLARALLGTGGFDPITGDPSEIYVIRRSAQGSVEEPLSIYHLDAADATRFAIATAMEMRPNDIVFVNPQPVTSWNRTLTQILPSTSFFTSLPSALSGFGGN